MEGWHELGFQELTTGAGMFGEPKFVSLGLGKLPLSKTDEFSENHVADLFRNS